MRNKNRAPATTAGAFLSEMLRDFSIGMDEVRNFRDGGQSPGEGIKQVEGRDGSEMGEHSENPDNPEDAGEEN